jgi:hypothetical protein
MKAKGLVWLGTSAQKFDDTVRFAGEPLGLRTVREEPDFVAFRLPDSDTVEVFGHGTRALHYGSASRFSGR